MLKRPRRFQRSEGLTPEARIQDSFFWSREDPARTAGMGDSLMEALVAALPTTWTPRYWLAREIGMLAPDISPWTGHTTGRAPSTTHHYVAELLYGRP